MRYKVFRQVYKLTKQTGSAYASGREEALSEGLTQLLEQGWALYDFHTTVTTLPEGTALLIDTYLLQHLSEHQTYDEAFSIQVGEDIDYGDLEVDTSLDAYYHALGRSRWAV